MSDITPADQFFPKPCAQSDSLLKKAANWIGLADSLQLKPIPADLSAPELRQELQVLHLKWDAARERFLSKGAELGPIFLTSQTDRRCTLGRCARLSPASGAVSPRRRAQCISS